MGQKLNTVLGANSPFVQVMPPPLVAQRVPTSTDTDYPIGFQWFYEPGGDMYTNIGGGTWDIGGNALATTTEPGIVTLFDTDTFVGADDTTVPTSLTVKTYVDNTAVAGAPVATETTAGIGELATDAEAVAGTPSTGTKALFVTPSNLSPVFAAPPAIGGTTPAAATVTNLTASGTISLDTTVATHYKVTGAADLTVQSTAGAVNLVSGEANADSISVQSTGGVDIDGALLVSISSSRNNANAIELVASAGGIDISAVGTAGEDIDILATGSSVNITATENVADSIVISSSNGGIDITAAAASAGEDIDITATGSSINLTSTENAALAIYLHADGGTSETIRLRADQGTDDASIVAISDVGGVTLSGGKAAATAVNLTASDTAGGITMTAGTGGILPTTTGPVTITSTYNNANNMYLHANGGTSETIKIHADQGTAVTSLNLLSDVGGITLRATGLASADAINLEAVAGGIDADAALQINVASSQAASNAIRLVASDAAGGFDIDSGTGGVIVDTTGAISLDAAAASNLTVTGAFALDLISTLGKVSLQSGQNAADSVEIKSLIGGIDILAVGAAAGEDIDIVATGSSVNIQATESDVNAITINASGVAGGINVDAGTNGFIVDTTGAVSLDSATASNFTVTGAADLTLQSTAGAVNVISGEANADSINVTSAGGMSIVATGAAAKDVLITCTSGSMTLSAGESITDAMNFTAGGAASGINLTAGTNGILLSSGQKCKVTSVAAAATPYTLLGTDYFVACDVTGGVLTITLPASPATGRTVIVSDSVGQAGANTITIDGNGKNISLGATAAGTKTITTAYKAVGLIYNGTLWNGFAMA